MASGRGDFFASSEGWVVCRDEDDDAEVKAAVGSSGSYEAFAADGAECVIYDVQVTCVVRTSFENGKALD